MRDATLRLEKPLARLLASLDGTDAGNAPDLADDRSLRLLHRLDALRWFLAGATVASWIFLWLE